MNLSRVNDIYSSSRLREAPESGPAAYPYSPLAASGEHFSGVFKPLLTERRTKGDGRHPDISNDLCVSIQVSVRSFTRTQSPGKRRTAVFLI